MHGIADSCAGAGLQLVFSLNQSSCQAQAHRCVPQHDFVFRAGCEFWVIERPRNTAYSKRMFQQDKLSWAFARRWINLRLGWIRQLAIKTVSSQSCTRVNNRLTPICHMTAVLSLLALASLDPSWLNWICHISSVWMSKVAVLIGMIGESVRFEFVDSDIGKVGEVGRQRL